jgi:hypothetical protein
MALLAELRAPDALAAPLGVGEGTLASVGLWESFDRMRYLRTWRLS